MNVKQGKFEQSGWDCEVEIFMGNGRSHKRWFTVYPRLPNNILEARALAFMEGGAGCEVVSVKKTTQQGHK